MFFGVFPMLMIARQSSVQEAARVRAAVKLASSRTSAAYEVMFDPAADPRHVAHVLRVRR